MKTNRAIQEILSTIFRIIKINPQTRKILATFLILVLFVLSLGMIQGTLGKFSRSLILADSAMAAKFDIIITHPEGFFSEQGENLFEYYFLSATDIKRLTFQVDNNGEADILCRPHINNGIEYRVYVAEEEHPEFIVKANDTVNFWLFIGPDGLDTNVKEAELFVDIRQMEGS